MNKNNTVRQAGGFIIQLMPGASEAIISRLEEKLKEISSITTLLDVGNTPEMILEYILGELGWRSEDVFLLLFAVTATKSGSSGH